MTSDKRENQVSHAATVNKAITVRTERKSSVGLACSVQLAQWSPPSVLLASTSRQTAAHPTLTALSASLAKHAISNSTCPATISTSVLTHRPLLTSQ